MCFRLSGARIDFLPMCVCVCVCVCACVCACVHVRRVVGCSKLNSGIFEAFEAASITATFCGHDHYRWRKLEQRLEREWEGEEEEQTC